MLASIGIGAGGGGEERQQHGTYLNELLGQPMGLMRQLSDSNQPGSVTLLRLCAIAVYQRGSCVTKLSQADSQPKSASWTWALECSESRASCFGSYNSRVFDSHEQLRTPPQQ